MVHGQFPLKQVEIEPVNADYASQCITDDALFGRTVHIPDQEPCDLDVLGQWNIVWRICGGVSVDGTFPMTAGTDCIKWLIFTRRTVQVVHDGLFSGVRSAIATLIDIV
jgi:hypothetical protein